MSVRESSVVKLNYNYAFRAVGLEIGNLFTLAYLYKQGLTPAQAFGAYAFIFVLRACLRPSATWMCRRFGLHAGLLFGTLVFAARYPLMIPLHSIDGWLIAFAVVQALGDVLYCVPYHFYFAVLGSTKSRGKGVGLREALSTAISVVTPLFSGFLLSLNNVYIFLIATAFTLAGLIPVWKLPCPPVPVKLNRAQRKKVSKRGFFGFVGSAMYNMTNQIWGLIVFLIVSGNYDKFGYLLALAAVFRAVGNMFFGRLIDKGKGWAITLAGFGSLIVITLCRLFFAHTVPVVIACDFFYGLALCLSVPSLMSVIYNDIKKSPHPLYYTYYMELGWDVGCIITLSCSAALAHFNLNPRFELLLGIAGIVLLLSILKRAYTAKDVKKS